MIVKVKLVLCHDLHWKKFVHDAMPGQAERLMRTNYADLAGRVDCSCMCMRVLMADLVHAGGQQLDQCEVFA